MIEKLKLRIKKCDERVLIGILVVLVILIALWIAHQDNDGPHEQVHGELQVPKGFLIVPVLLSNGLALSNLIDKKGVVDIFSNQAKTIHQQALIENLRIIKLSGGEEAQFGALVPDKLAGQLQDSLSRPGLRAALRTAQAGPTRFNGKSRSSSLLIEIPTGD